MTSFEHTSALAVSCHQSTTHVLSNTLKGETWWDGDTDDWDNVSIPPFWMEEGQDTITHGLVIRVAMWVVCDQSSVAAGLDHSPAITVETPR